MKDCAKDAYQDGSRIRGPLGELQTVLNATDRALRRMNRLTLGGAQAAESVASIVPLAPVGGSNDNTGDTGVPQHGRLVGRGHSLQAAVEKVIAKGWRRTSLAPLIRSMGQPTGDAAAVVHDVHHWLEQQHSAIDGGQALASGTATWEVSLQYQQFREGHTSTSSRFFWCNARGVPQGHWSSHRQNSPPTPSQKDLYMAFRGRDVTPSDRSHRSHDEVLKEATGHMRVARVHAFLKRCQGQTTSTYAFVTELHGVRQRDDESSPDLHSELRAFDVRLLAEPRNPQQGLRLLPVKTLVAKVALVPAEELGAAEHCRDPWQSSARSRLPPHRQWLWLQSHLSFRSLMTRYQDPHE